MIDISDNEQILPREIETSYMPSGLARARKLGEGMINATMLAESATGQKLVLQRLSPIFGTDLITDYDVISHHLKIEDWEIPRLVKTTTEQLYETDNSGAIWRAFEYIKSDPDEVETEKLGSLAIYGELLGKLHRSLAKLDYHPQFALPYFHDTQFYAGVLEAVLSDLSESETQQFAKKLLTTYRETPPLPTTGGQLIHGDPRISNILHRDGVPFAFIDWDTLMHGTVWIDIGDMLRSVSENAVKAGMTVPIEALAEVAEEYRKVARPQDNPHEFQTGALKAAQLIALELAMRFTADYQEGEAGYFTWDASTYLSRHEHNMIRARQQWEIFTQIQTYIGTNGEPL